MTITRCRHSSGGATGVIGRHVRLLNQHGEISQEGTSALLPRCRDSEGSDESGDDAARRDSASVHWARRLAELLGKNETFQSGTASFGGATGLQAGDVACRIRPYKSQIPDVAARTPEGPTFTIVADEIDWVELALSDRNDFVPRARRGQFRATGNTCEYLRLAKAITGLATLCAGGGQGQAMVIGWLADDRHALPSPAGVPPGDQ